MGQRKYLFLAGIAGMAGLVSLASAGALTSDEEVVFDANGSSDYYVTSTTDALIAPTGIANLDPTLSLEIGKRYKFTYASPGSHPFTLIAKDVTDNDSLDAVLLAQGTDAGSLETDVDINWQNPSNGPDFYFTLTPALADALNGSGTQSPGYRCNIHTTSMRGGISFRQIASGLAWPSGTADFEDAALGSTINEAFGWAIVTNDAVNYVPTISDSPAGHPNEAVGSTRWLTVVDNHDDATVNDRVYPQALTPPGAEAVSTYTFTYKIDVQSTAAGTLVRNITQHHNGSSFVNAGGLQFTSTGAQVVIIGTDDGGVGKAGPTDTATLFNYADAGFAQNGWIDVSFTFDLDTGTVSASATGSGGQGPVTASLNTLALQGVDANNFRFCIRNHSAGNTSTVSYDDLSFAGTSVAADVKNWNTYE